MREMSAIPDVIHELRQSLGEAAVDTVPQNIRTLLRDNSWLSPVLMAELDEREKREGETLGVSAVVKPDSEAQVLSAVKIAVQHGVPITPRGAGTSNFGLITPERGGLIFDLRNLLRQPEMEGSEIRAGAGVFQGELERVAQEQGRELPMLTTTYATATAAGWIVGGHVGLGSSTHGSVWDDIVRELRVVTATDEPEVLTLKGEEVEPLLHTFGAFGIITELVQRTEELHDWVEAIAFFPTFEIASHFVTELAFDDYYRHRVVSAQEESLMPAFKALKSVMQPGSGVFMIVDRGQIEKIRKLITSLGGTFTEWQTWKLEGCSRVPIATMVYGHRLLWVKRFLPDAGFLHVYLNPDDADADIARFKTHFGDEVLLEMKYIRSPWMMNVLFGNEKTATAIPAAVITISNGSKPDAVKNVMRFCDEEGILYQNPHTSVIEDNGLFKDMAPLLDFKRKVDPHNLLHPGRVRSVERSAA